MEKLITLEEYADAISLMQKYNFQRQVEAIKLKKKQFILREESNAFFYDRLFDFFKERFHDEDGEWLSKDAINQFYTKYGKSIPIIDLATISEAEFSKSRKVGNLTMTYVKDVCTKYGIQLLP
jgi:hypothetical protein